MEVVTFCSSFYYSLIAFNNQNINTFLPSDATENNPSLKTSGISLKSFMEYIFYLGSLNQCIELKYAILRRPILRPIKKFQRIVDILLGLPIFM